MDLDPQNTGTAVGITAFALAFGRWAWLRLLDRVELWIFASAERNRRREVKRVRRESFGPQYNAVPFEHDDETTDRIELIELERKERKASKVGTHTRAGQRLPRAGTNHDKPYGDKR